MTSPPAIEPAIEPCAQEPIRVPGRIQPTGVLFAFGPDLGAVSHVSVNVAEVFGLDPARVLGERPDRLFPGEAGAEIVRCLGLLATSEEATVSQPVRLGRGGNHLAILHRHDDRVILELEETPAEGVRSPYPELRSFLAAVSRIDRIDELARHAAAEVRRLIGFDRVLVYRFERDDQGTVVGEDGNGVLPSYMGLRFPATDIPTQARELYRLNRLRIISDVNYEPVPILGGPDDRPLDLTYSTLRAVSPVHLEYMRNMGTAASMSISILRDGRLWGLIACHNRTPRAVAYERRVACDFLGQILSLEVSALERGAESERKAESKSLQARLLDRMAREENFVEGLVKDPSSLLDLVSAGGAAILFRDECALVGETPAEADVRALVAWIGRQGRDDVFATDAIGEVFPWASGLKDVAAGVLAIPISKLHRSYVVWFRAEFVRTVNWAGEPEKPTEAGVIHPRQSFALWKETVRNTSRPWEPFQVDAALEFRNAIVGVVLLRAEELAELSTELKRTNRELEAFSYSVSHDLRAPLRHIVGYSELLLDETDLSDQSRRFVDTIIHSAHYAGTLVDNLLSLAQMGRMALHLSSVSLKQVVEDVRRDVQNEVGDRAIAWRIGELPTLPGDPMMLKLAVRNLISNAIKYTRARAEAIIEVDAIEGADDWVIRIGDNGIGFDMKYVGKLFGVFQRLHRMEEYEGTGIGLANVHRIVERHGGKVWAEGRPDVGATFRFSLPKTPFGQRD